MTVRPQNKRQLVACLRLLGKLGEQYIVVGNGSNILANDGFFDGVAVVTKDVNAVRIRGNVVTADCGTNTAKIFALLVSSGLGDGEFLGCIPSTVGGAVRGNAGCFGQDVASVVQSVTAVTDNGRLCTLTAEECAFSKRDSIFKRNGWTVLSAKMRFTPSTPQSVRQKFAEMHAKKLPRNRSEFRRQAVCCFIRGFRCRPCWTNWVSRVCAWEGRKCQKSTWVSS